MTVKILTTKCLIPVGSLIAPVNGIYMAALVQNNTYYIFSHIYMSKTGAWAQGTKYSIGDKIAAFNELYGTQVKPHSVSLVQDFK